MKSKLTKLISMLLVIASLLSVFAVFSFAAEGAEGEEEQKSSVELLLNRTFDEGWPVSNGVSNLQKVQSIDVDYEELADATYNYFTRLKITDGTSNSSKDGHIEFNFGSSPKSGGAVVEFDITTDAYFSIVNNKGACTQLGYGLTTSDSKTRTYVSIYGIKDNKLVIFNGNSVSVDEETGETTLGAGSVEVASLAGQWVHVAMVYQFEQNIAKCSACNHIYEFENQGAPCPNEVLKKAADEEAGTEAEYGPCGNTSKQMIIRCRTYFGNTDIFDAKNAINIDNVAGFNADASAEATYYRDSYIVSEKTGTAATFYNMRFGFVSVAAEHVGMSYNIDNLLIYRDLSPEDAEGNRVDMDVVEGIDDVATYGYGSKVNETATKTITILGGGEGKNYIGEGIIMKIGSDYMLNRNNREPIFVNKDTGKPYGAPVKRDGIVYVPFEPFLSATGYPVYPHEDGISYDISTAAGSSTLTLNRDVAIINGKRVELTAAPMLVKDPDDETNTYPVIAMNDVEKFFQGYYITYDDMGMIIFSEGKNVISRKTDLKQMLSLMKSFIYDYSGAGDLTDEELGELYDKIETNTKGFDHPYLLADQEQFDTMNKIYEGEITGQDMYREWLKNFVEKCDANFNKFAQLPAEREDAKKIRETDEYGFIGNLMARPANESYTKYAYETNPGKYKLLAYEITNPFSGIKEGMFFSDIWRTASKKDAVNLSDEEKAYQNIWKVANNGNVTYPFYKYAAAPDENGYYYPSVLHQNDTNGKHYNDGYDYAGGRNSYAVEYADHIRNFALAYQITRDDKYAIMAYDIMVSLCDNNNWHNWSHKHHLSVGELLSSLAPAYDWMYDKWDELEHDRDAQYSLDYLTQQMYRKSLYYSYDISRYARTSDVWTRDASGYVNGIGKGIWNWSECDINWNCVCNCGIVLGAMALVGEDTKEGRNSTGIIDYTENEEHDDGANRVLWCMGNNLWNIAQYGLVQYAPDGSYIEAVGYWGFATNYFAQMLYALEPCFGDDMGFYESPGVEKTFYFAAQGECTTVKNNKLDVSYQAWGYHDGSSGAVNTDSFFYAADVFDDPALAAIRLQQIKSKGVSWRDIVAYKPEYADLTIEDAPLPLDWEFQACDGIVARSSWEDFSLFAGLMGGKNHWGQHGHMDSGAFTYANEGYYWIPDIGSDEYNIYEYFGWNGIRERYYRMSTEGHNLVTITSLYENLPYGQTSDGDTWIEKWESFGSDGMYAILDNAGAYGSAVYWANRGMMLTNSRKTMVIQDEISFNGMTECAWIAHTQAQSVYLSDDKKTAFFYQQVGGENKYLRLSLISPENQNLKFEIMTCGIKPDGSDFLLKDMKVAGWSESMGQLPERSREGLRRVVIKSGSTMKFNVAVVFEMVEGLDSGEPVEYDYTLLNKWKPQAEFTGGSGSSSESDKETAVTAKMTDIRTYGNQATQFIENNFAFDKRIVDFFKLLARVNAAVNTYRPETFANIPAIQEAYLAYLKNIQLFNAFRDDVNKYAASSSALGARIVK